MLLQLVADQRLFEGLDAEGLLQLLGDGDPEARMARLPTATSAPLKAVLCHLLVRNPRKTGPSAMYRYGREAYGRNVLLQSNASGNRGVGYSEYQGNVFPYNLTIAYQLNDPPAFPRTFLFVKGSSLLSLQFLCKRGSHFEGDFKRKFLGLCASRDPFQLNFTILLLETKLREAANQYLGLFSFSSAFFPLLFLFPFFEKPSLF
jgi:hypothetical protein